MVICNHWWAKIGKVWLKISSMEVTKQEEPIYQKCWQQIDEAMEKDAKQEHISKSHSQWQ